MEYKCCASIDGICRNIIGIGTKCNGHSKECSLRKHYQNFDQIAKNLSQKVKDVYGVKGDLE